jgi:hypothetical protein
VFLDVLRTAGDNTHSQTEFRVLIHVGSIGLCDSFHFDALHIQTVHMHNADSTFILDGPKC